MTKTLQLVLKIIFVWHYVWQMSGIYETVIDNREYLSRDAVLAPANPEEFWQQHNLRCLHLVFPSQQRFPGNHKRFHFDHPPFPLCRHSNSAQKWLSSDHSYLQIIKANIINLDDLSLLVQLISLHRRVCFTAIHHSTLTRSPNTMRGEQCVLLISCQCQRLTKKKVILCSNCDMKQQKSEQERQQSMRYKTFWAVMKEIVKLMAL